MRRQEDHQARNETDEVVVVEVGGAIEEFEPREAGAEQRGAQPVAIARGDPERTSRHCHDMPMRPDTRPRSNPLEAGIGKEEGGLQEQLLDPAAGEETEHRDGHQQAEQDAKQGKRINRHTGALHRVAPVSRHRWK